MNRSMKKKIMKIVLNVLDSTTSWSLGVCTVKSIEPPISSWNGGWNQLWSQSAPKLGATYPHFVPGHLLYFSCRPWHLPHIHIYMYICTLGCSVLPQSWNFASKLGSQNYYFQACRQWSPMVAKGFQGPRGILRLKA